MRQSRAQTLTVVLTLGAGLVLGAYMLKRVKRRTPARVFDYSDRSGFPRPVEEMRGSARTKKERASSPLSATAPM
jgi:hypothetical protein